MKFYIYEDWTEHVAVVHHDHCRHCNNGEGRGRGRNPRDSKWHGPYGSEDAVRSAPLRARTMLRDCISCIE